MLKNETYYWIVKIQYLNVLIDKKIISAHSS